MSINVNAKTITAGLVFEYDTGNQKSYLGKPTSNEIFSQSLSYGSYAFVSAASVITSDDQFRNQRSMNRYSITAVTNTARGMFTPNVSLNVPYTFSCYMRYNGTQSASPSWACSAAKSSPESGSTITLSQNTATISQSLSNNWWYVLYNFTVSANTNNACILTFGLNTFSDSSYIGNTFDVYNPQLEQWPVATPYTPTIRNITSSLFDLANGRTVNMISASYDTASSAPYYSSSNYLIISNTNNAPTKLTGSQWTWDFWFKSTSNGGYRALYSTGVFNHPLGFSSLFFNPGTYFLRLNAGSGSAITGSDPQVDKIFSTPTITSQSYYHLAMTYHSSSGYFLYLNGAYCDSASWTSSLGASTADTTIGTGWSGDIPIHKQYNRTLSPAEVKTNYDVHRSRFGL
jgi:hypothetical protein